MFGFEIKRVNDSHYYDESVTVERWEVSLAGMMVWRSLPIVPDTMSDTEAGGTAEFALALREVLG